ncbi:hypothetical protein MRX96_025429 [Rhipicephalus microplus]
MRSVRPCKGELQLARQLHQMWPDPPGRELQTDPAPPDPSRRLANLVASHSRDSSPLALLPLWPRRWPLLFLRPRLLQLPLSRPSLLLLSPEAGLLCPRLLWPRLLRQ